MTDDILDLALIIQSDAFGGTERHTLELVNYVNAKELKSAFVYCGEGFNGHIEEHYPPAIKSKANTKVRKLTFQDIRVWHKTFKTHSAKKVLLIKPSYFSIDLKFLFLVRLYYRNLIVIEHSLPPRRPPVPRIGFIPKIGYWRLKNELLRYFFAKLPNKVIAVSERARTELDEHTYYKNVIVCRNGVDTGFWMRNEKEGDKFCIDNDIPSDLHLFGCVGNLFPVKAFHIAIHALSLISEEHKKQCALCIIGVGPEYKNLKELAEKLNVDNVFFVGKQIDMVSAYSAIQTLLITSSSESASLALLEATACDCDVLSSDVGNSAEVINEMKNGVIINSRNPYSWAKAIETQLDERRYKNHASAVLIKSKFKQKYEVKNTMDNLIGSIMGKV